MLELLIQIGVFIVGVLLFGGAYFVVSRTIAIRQRLAGTGAGGSVGLAPPVVLEPGEEGSSRVEQAIETFYRSLSIKNVNAIERRLVRAGYFSPSALYYFYGVRVAAAFVIFMLVAIMTPSLVPDVAASIILYVAGATSFLAFILPNFILDRLGKRQEERYRRAFPDFMDMLIVCADAGLSLEASITRVSKEFLVSNREFGIHLSIMMLEVRAGKRLREALQGFADRLELEEARSLATVFKQSEELGASLIQTLRVFSNEMRRNRIIRAEEKANSLPVRMVVPLGVFIFPVMLMVVLMPVILSLLTMIGKNSPT